LRDIRKEPPTSARGTALTFWYEVQQRNLPAAYRLLDPTFVKQYAKDFKHFNDYVLADYARWLVKPRIVTETTSGKNAQIVVSYSTPGDPRARTTFDLRKAAGRWKITYEFYLALRLTATQQAGRSGRP